MDKPTHSQYKEVFQVIKAVLTSKEKGLKMNPKSISLNAYWTLQKNNDTDWGTDQDTRISVYELSI